MEYHAAVLTAGFDYSLFFFVWLSFLPLAELNELTEGLEIQLSQHQYNV